MLDKYKDSQKIFYDYFNRINDIKFKDNYIKELCSYDCSYFILKKVKK